MSTKQVTITVTQSIHQVDKNGKVKKLLTTYEVMKPVETLKQLATQNTWAIGRSPVRNESIECASVEKCVFWWFHKNVYIVVGSFANLLMAELRGYAFLLTLETVSARLASARLGSANITVSPLQKV